MKKQNLITFIALGIAILVAIATRLYKLGEAPQGLYLDEAAQGYNAYSILKTGKDEFGKGFPIVFRSFTDFKTPVYIYLVTPLIPLFDLTKFTVRFPSFFFSILTVPILYLIINKLLMINGQWLKETKSEKLNMGNQSLAIIASFLLAISPWHILFGRTNFECNVALFFFLTGVLFFYKGLNKPKILLLSALMFAIAVPAYHAQRVITPLMMLILFIRHKNVLLAKTHIKYLAIGLVIGAVILAPTFTVAKTPGFLARAGLNIFNYQKQKPAGFLENCDKELICKVANSRPYLHAREFSALYVSYFSPRNMFVLGDYGPRSSYPMLATFFVWQAPFYILGLYLLVRDKKMRELRFFILSLLLISPLPAAVTRDPYTTIRALQMVIPQTLIIAIGILGAFRFSRTVFKKYIAPNYYYLLTALFTLGIFSYSLLRLYSSVLVLNEYYRASEWNYGLEEVAAEIKKLDTQIPAIVDNARTEPYSQLLFFLKFDPATYQKDNFEVSLNDYYTDMTRNKEKHIGKVTTRAINWESDLTIDQYLIGDALAISYEQIANHKLSLEKEIKFPDGSVAFRVVRTNPDFEKKFR